MTIVPSGVLVPRIEPGNPEWLTIMSASKIAAVLGLSPWESRFSLYHRMTGMVGDDGNEQTRRGHYLEPAIAAWFADQHPDWRLEETGTWLHPERRWQAATPDRIVHLPDGTVELVECKSSGMFEGWGDPGTDTIPVYYRGQVIWQLDTLGLQRCHVAVILPFLEFRSYVVEYDPGEAQFMRDTAADFLADIRNGNRPPIDGSDATYQVVRQLHPDIDGDDREIPANLALDYRIACAEYDAAELTKRGLTSEIIDLMGTARYATWQSERVAMRVPGRKGKPPFLRPCKATTKGETAA